MATSIACEYNLLAAWDVACSSLATRTKVKRLYAQAITSNAAEKIKTIVFAKLL